MLVQMPADGNDFRKIFLRELLKAMVHEFCFYSEIEFIFLDFISGEGVPLLSAFSNAATRC
jgi:hypothetical protein